MSDDALRAWQFYIDDMIGFADKVIAFTDASLHLIIRFESIEFEIRRQPPAELPQPRQ